MSLPTTVTAVIERQMPAWRCVYCGQWMPAGIGDDRPGYCRRHCGFCGSPNRVFNRGGKPLQVRPEVIIAAVAEVHELSVEQLRSAAREGHIAKARQRAFYVLRNYRALPLAKIGELLNRDHSTVLHGVNRVQTWLNEKDYETVEAIDAIHQRLAEDDPS